MHRGGCSESVSKHTDWDMGVQTQQILDLWLLRRPKCASERALGRQVDMEWRWGWEGELSVEIGECECVAWAGAVDVGVLGEAHLRLPEALGSFIPSVKNWDFLAS